MYKYTHIKTLRKTEINRAKAWRKYKGKNTAEKRRLLWSQFEEQKTVVFGGCISTPETPNYINSLTNLILKIMEMNNEKAMQAIASENNKENAINWVVPQATIEMAISKTIEGFLKDLATNLEIKVTEDLCNIDWNAVVTAKTKEEQKQLVNTILLDPANAWLTDCFQNLDEKRTAELKQQRKQRNAIKKQEKAVASAYEILAMQFGISVDEAKARFIEMCK